MERAHARKATDTGGNVFSFAVDVCCATVVGLKVMDSAGNNLTSRKVRITISGGGCDSFMTDKE